MNKQQLAQVIIAAINKLQEIEGEELNNDEQMVENAIELFLQNPDMTPKEVHQFWYDEKIKDGWKLGPVRNVEKKESPHLVDFEELSLAQKMKDAVAIVLVKAYGDLSEGEYARK